MQLILLISLLFFSPQKAELSATGLMECSKKDVVAVDAYLQNSGFRLMNQYVPEGTIDYFYEYDDTRGTQITVIAAMNSISQYIILTGKETSQNLLEGFKNAGFSYNNTEGDTVIYKSGENSLKYIKTDSVYQICLIFKN
ncbi:MAG: hypothetical protein ACOZCO_14990 [Bacteroidota bacterium]